MTGNVSGCWQWARDVISSFSQHLLQNRDSPQAALSVWGLHRGHAFCGNLTVSTYRYQLLLTLYGKISSTVLVTFSICDFRDMFDFLYISLFVYNWRYWHQARTVFDIWYSFYIFQSFKCYGGPPSVISNLYI